MYNLHYAPDNASLIVRMALTHVGASYRTTLVDRARKAQRSPAYLALNPNGLIPVLETPDGPLFETAAILLYLAERHAGLLPSAPERRAMAVKWLIWLATTLHTSERILFYPDQYTAGDSESVRSSARARLRGQLALLEAAADAPWLDGRPCAPAFYLAPLLRWPHLYGGTPWFDLADYPRLLAFARTLEATQTVAISCQAEGLGPTPFSAPQRPNPPEGSAI